MVELLRENGCDVHLALLKGPLTGDLDLGEMRQYWGSRLHVLRTFTQSRYTLLKLADKVIRKARPLFSPDIRTFRESSLDVDKSYHPWWDVSLGRLIRKLRFDVVLSEYIFASRSLLALPASVVKIIDTHDRFADRNERLKSAGIDSSWWSTTAAAEYGAMDRADLVIAIQDEEAELFRRGTKARVITVGDLPQAVASPRPGTNANPTLFVVGSEYQVNADGIVWFVDEILPNILARVPDAELHVVGGVCGMLDGRISSTSVKLLGKIDDIAAAYDRSHAVLNPVRFGTGLAIKSIEALSRGKPLIATPAGGRGLEAAIGLKAMEIHEDPNAMAEACISILTNHGLRLEMGKAALQFSRQWRDMQSRELLDHVCHRTPT